MEDTNHIRPSLSRSGANRGSTAGGIGLLTLLAGGLFAVSYPLLAAALAIGVVAGYFARRVAPAVRHRIRGTVRTQDPVAGKRYNSHY